MSNKNEKVILKYIKAIHNFEEDLISISRTKKTNIKGYLINLDDLDNLKKKLNYNDKVKKITNLGFVQLSDSEKIFTIEDIKIKTSQYLLNMIYYNNKYIMINEQLWKVLCEKGREKENPILYNLDSNIMTFQLDNKKLTFKQNEKNRNIIDKDTYDDLTYGDSVHEIKEIYNDINKYYKFEKVFLNEIKEKKSSFKSEIIVTKKWFDKWLKYTNYEEIKNKYLEKGETNEKKIKNELIYYREIKKYKYSELSPIEIINFKEIKELESYIKNTPIIIINSNISQNTKDQNNNTSNYIKYYAYENKIEIPLKDGSFLINSNNNIIQFNPNNNNENIINQNDKKSSNENENNNIMYIKQLIKIFYFNKKINEQIKSNKNTLSNNNNIYLINKNIINKYKEFFNYNHLCNILNNNPKLKEIKYDILENNFPKIIEEIKKETQYFNKINLKQLSLELNDNILNKEEININAKFYEYYIDFEIINEDINTFFIQNNIIKKEQNITGIYIAGNNKIFINFIIKYDIIYEICSLDSNNFEIEYLIEGTSNGYKENIINYFKENDI